MTLEEATEAIKAPDEAAMQAAKAWWDSRAKLPGSLGALETMVIRLAGIQRTARPQALRKRAVVFCADNGVAAQGVTPSSVNVTADQAVNFVRGGGTINAFARGCGAQVQVVDVGIATDYEEPGVLRRTIRRGTGDIAAGPAMTPEECRAAVETGIAAAAEAADEGIQIVITGEMGIGNTTTSSAVAALLLDKPLETVTARGAGTPERVAHKIEVLRRAIALNQPDPGDPLDVLAKVGGLDIAALCGLYIGCAARGLAAFIDGVISGAAALCAARLAPPSREYMLPSHCSAEPAGRLLLEALGFSPLLTAGMCLGEGTGGALGALLLDQALAAYTDVVGIEDIGRRK